MSERPTRGGATARHPGAPARPRRAARLAEAGRRTLNVLTHRIRSLPVLVLMAHSRCNCRCVMCDIWKANRVRREVSRERLEHHVDAMRRLRVQWVVLSGGEPLMHSNLWSLCELIRDLPARITLLSTGLLLERHAGDVVRWCDDVVVSLDGGPAVHDAIRNVPGAFDRLAAGVAALRRARPGFPVTGRCVLQRLNFEDLPEIIRSARRIGLDRISFLAADVSSEAFNRPEPWGEERAAEVALDRDRTAAFADVVERCIEEFADEFASGFIAEPPDRLRRLPRYYAALNGDAEFPVNRCNAPWVSAVVEADGAVRPCFFHPAHGTLDDGPLDRVLNSEEAVRFRRRLDVREDPVCRRCVCTLELGPTTAVSVP